MILAYFSRKIDELLHRMGDTTDVKFIVIRPDDNIPIELEIIQYLDGGDGSLVIRLRVNEAKKELSKL